VGESETVLCGTGTVYWEQQGGETAVSGRERNGNVRDCYCLLGAAGVGETAVMVTERKCILWTGTGYWGQEEGVIQQNGGQSETVS